MKYKINGLIPESQIPENAFLGEGDEVEAEVVRIDTSRHMVDLRFIRKLEPEGDREQEWEPPHPVGKQLKGTISHISRQKDFMLVTLPDGFTAMLHISNMSENFQNRFERGDFQVGSSLEVEVASIEKRKKRLQLRNIDFQ